WASRVPELAEAELARQSFAGLLTDNPPEPVRQKLTGWGVSDYVSIFARAVGLNAVFAEPPALSLLSEDFLRGYHRYADHLFRCFLESHSYSAIRNANFTFDLYASGEYSKLSKASGSRLSFF